ncbi:HAD-IA family hydrolase [Rubripirellula amarantea]|nr:HAD-IA family hydrolase [Rubripirellula amarantea]
MSTNTEPSLTTELLANYAERYDGLIFDCDGTLSHSMPLHYIAWRDTMARYGIEFLEDRFYSMGGMPSEQIIAILSHEQNVSVPTDQAAAEKEAAFADQIFDLMPVTAIVEVVRQHVGRLPMSVASGGIRPIIDQQLQQIGLDSIFAAIVTAEDTERHKPEPDVFLEAARRLNIPPERCIVFEDSPLGFTAAFRAGMDCVDVRPFHQK